MDPLVYLQRGHKATPKESLVVYYFNGLGNFKHPNSLVRGNVYKSLHVFTEHNAVKGYQCVGIINVH